MQRFDMISILEHWEAVVGLLTFLAGGGWIGWKLKNIEVKAATSRLEKTDTEAVKAIRDLYGDFVGDYEKRYEELKADVAIIRSELNDVKKENIEQRKDLRLLHKENKELRAELANWRDKYNALKLEFDMYRAKDAQLLRISSDGT